MTEGSGTHLCLNPCSNGILKYRVKQHLVKECLLSLNPCSNGILKYRVKRNSFVELVGVLILVLMEY